MSRLLLFASLMGAATNPAHAEIQGDPRDQPIVGFAVNQALEFERSGVPIPWSNANTGRKGTIVLEAATYSRPDGPCRAYRRTIERPGFTTAEIRGSACRIGPALWSVEESVVTAAVAVTLPAMSPAAAPSASAPPPRKTTPAHPDAGKASSDKTSQGSAVAGTAKADSVKADNEVAPRSKPSLPAYTLPSKAGS